MRSVRSLLLVFISLLGPALSAGERVVYHADWFPGAQFAGVYLALDQGLYAQAGLDVEIIPFAFGQKTTGAIASSEVCAIGTIEGYIFLQKRAGGEPLLALSAMLQEGPAGFMSMERTPVRNARDFAGKRIGVHAFADPLYRWFVAHGGLKPDDATMVFTDDDVTRLTRNELDLMQGFATEEFIRLQMLTGSRSHFISFRELGFDTYSQIVFTTPGQLDRHRDAIRRFLEVTREGWSRAFAESDAAIAAVQKRTGEKVSADFIRAALKALQPYVAPEGRRPLAPMQPAKWERMQEIGVEMGFVKTLEPVGNFLVPDLLP